MLTRTIFPRVKRPGPIPLGEHEPWCVAFINVLVSHGADQGVDVAAVDRLADLFRRHEQVAWMLCRIDLGDGRG